MRFTHGVQISLRSIVIYIPELVQDMSNFTAFIFRLDKFHNPDDLLISLAVADGISNNAILCLFCNFKLLFFVLTMKSYDFEVRVNLVVYIFLMVGLIGRWLVFLRDLKNCDASLFLLAFFGIFLFFLVSPILLILYQIVLIFSFEIFFGRKNRSKLYDLTVRGYKVFFSKLDITILLFKFFQLFVNLLLVVSKASYFSS